MKLRIAVLGKLYDVDVDVIEEAIPAEILAVISATVTATVGRPARVRQISLVQPDSSWAQHGRSVIHTSHRLRK